MASRGEKANRTRSVRRIVKKRIIPVPYDADDPEVIDEESDNVDMDYLLGLTDEGDEDDGDEIEAGI